MFAGDAYEEGGWLVADELGRPYYPDSISGMFDKKIKAAGLRRIRLHDCRHTAATLMLADGVPVKTVADLLGHDPRITLATYAHTVPGLGERPGLHCRPGCSATTSVDKALTRDD